MNKLYPLLLAGAAPLAAAQDSPDTYELEVTAIHQRRSETALPVTVLTGKALQDAARATLGDTLSSQPGINNASFGPAVGQTVIRGQQGRRVLQLTNSIPNADASGNSADHALTVEPILADTLEVLRGPSTLLYGGGAIGGVVNVVDNRVPRALRPEPSLQLEARHDSAADQDNLIGRLDFSTGRLSWHLDGLRREWNDVEIPGFAIDPAYLEEHDHEEDGEHQHQDGEQHAHPENSKGFVPNTAGRTEAFTLGGSYVFGRGFLGLSVSRLDNDYGLPPGSHAHAHHAHEEGEEEEAGEDRDHAHGADLRIGMQRTRYDLAGEWRDLGPLLERLRYNLSYSDYQHAEMEAPGQVSTRFDNESWQQRLQLTHAELAGWHGVLGWQSAREDFGAQGEESFIPLTRSRSDGVFLVEDYHLADVTFELGARYQRDEYDPQAAGLPTRAFSTRSYSASALWDWSEPLSFGLTWSHAERAPSVEELYSNVGLADLEDCVIHFATGACEVGSQGFGRETSNNLDFSVFLERGWLSATLTVFHNRFRDYIFQGSSGLELDGFPIRHYGQTDATFTGVELDAGIQLSENLEWRLFADAIDGRLDGNGAAPRLPPARLGSQVTLSGERWSAFVELLHAADQDEPGRHELATEGYTRWNLGGEYRLESGAQGLLTLFVKGRNVTDEEIRLSTSYLRGFAPEAGRSVELGLRYQY